MKKLFKAFLLCFTLLFISCNLSGCSSSFFGKPQEESLQIKEITTLEQEDGSIQITITYTDEEKEPTIFSIPKAENGDPGKDGVGIKDISYSLSEDGKSTIVTITYTDSNLAPTTISIPNGVSITGTNYRIDEETGNTIITFIYSDGTTSNEIYIPEGEKGEKGEDGNSIIGYDQIVNDDGSVTLIFYFSQSEDVVVQIPAPQKGENGKGIASIVSGEINNEYTMTITYTDGSVDTLKWAKPEQPNRWYTGSEPANSLGVDGDFYFDVYHHNIYVKQNGRWVLVVSLDTEEETHIVRFNLNDSSSEPANMPQGSLIEYQIPRGAYFAAAGYNIPIPTRNGYTFKGWYTQKVITPTTGCFTDLTPVFADLVLYAQWEKIETI